MSNMKWWVGRGVVGNSRGIFSCAHLALTWRNWRRPRTCKLGLSITSRNSKYHLEKTASGCIILALWGAGIWLYHSRSVRHRQVESVDVECWINGVSVLNFIYVNNSMEQSHCSEADSGLSTQEMSRLLWNLEVYYRVHKSPPIGSYPEPDESSQYPHIVIL
jgi:hypothetical protein